MQQSIEEQFPTASVEVRALATVIREVVRSTLPEATEIFYHGALGYGPTASGFDRILYIAPQRDYVNLGFFYGAALDDPSNLLEGTGARMRHIKIRQRQDATRAEVEQLIRQAWNVGVGLVAARHRPARKA